MNLKEFERKTATVCSLQMIELESKAAILLSLQIIELESRTATVCSLQIIELESRTATVCSLQIIELERKAAEQGQAVRGAHVGSWANADVAPEDMYFLDSRGDRNNLVYNGLYRADIAAYHRTDPGGLARGATQHHGRHNQRYVCCICLCQTCVRFPVHTGTTVEWELFLPIYIWQAASAGFTALK